MRLLQIMKYRPECLIPAGLTDMNELIARWLSWLPIWEDNEATEHVYGYLCDLVEANNSAVLGGAANSNLPRIVAAIARVIAENGLLRPEEEEEPPFFLLEPPDTPESHLKSPRIKRNSSTKRSNSGTSIVAASSQVHSS